MCNCTKQTKLLEFHIQFCGLTLLATKETTREAKGFAAGEAQDCNCSSYDRSVYSDETIMIENFAVQLLFIPKQTYRKLEAYWLKKIT